MQLFKSIFRHFRPGVALSLFTLALLPVLVGLGFWQLGRAEYKERIAVASHAEPLRVSSLADLPDRLDRGFRARLRGRYLADADLLLDNQPLEGRPGLAVLTPLRLNRGGLLLVSRAWIPAAGDRRDFAAKVPPLPQEPAVELLAEVQPLPQSLLDSSGARDGWPKLVQKIDRDELHRWFDETVAEAIAWQLPPAGQPRGSLPVPPSAGMTPMRHYGYALQWFALAATLLAMYLGFGFRRQAALDDR